MHRSRGRIAGRFGALLAGSVVAASCAGDNLFQLAGSVGGGGPSVTITTPSEGLNVTQGASLQVTADASSNAGIIEAKISGVYKSDGTAAYNSQTQTFGAIPTVTINRTLGAVAGGATGSVYVIVSVTDQAGDNKADTVTVVIN